MGRAGAGLVAYTPRLAPRQPGRLAGKIVMSPDFAETPQWLIDAFEGNG